MRALGPLVLTVLFFGVLGAFPAMAQQPSGAGASWPLSSSSLDRALAVHESAVDQQRAHLTELLSRPQVREIAVDHGIDMGRVEFMAAGLSDGEVSRIAGAVADITAAQQDGGLGTVTISVGVAIIVLLILILAT